MFEGLVGNNLQELGYPPEAHTRSRTPGLIAMRAQYYALFRTKFYLRTKTWLGRRLVTRDLSWI